MNRSEIIELALIPIVIVAVWLSEALPEQLGLGKLTLWLAALLLGQGFLRDLWFLASRKKKQKTEPKKQTQCLCLESTLGLTGILLGALLFVSGFDRSMLVDAWQWSVLILVTTGVGFMIKDYVLVWSPFGLRRDPNHMNIIVSWKSTK